MSALQEVEPNWHEHFAIQSDVDLDFVIGQNVGWPVGMERRSPPEFRRRVLAAAKSYVLQLSSIDYTLKRYVDPDQYSANEIFLGDTVSDFIRHSADSLKRDLKILHTEEPSFGRFGSELTLFKFPDILDVVRMLSNRGLFLESLPVLRLSLEMTAWAVAVFESDEENYVTRLRAQTCVSALKVAHASAGRVYGYISKFSHWEKAIHPVFLHTAEKNVGVIRASTKYRALSLTLCLIVLDIFLKAVGHLYGKQSDTLVMNVQGTTGTETQIHDLVRRVLELTRLDEIRELKGFLG